MSLLKISNLVASVNDQPILRGIELEVCAGEVHAIMGPNGSGKSTTINLICGMISATNGAVHLDGRDLRGLSSHQIVAAGIGRTFQNIRLFQGLTVWQNLWVALQERAGTDRPGFISRWLSGQRDIQQSLNSQLSFAGLVNKRDVLAGNLSFGEQRRLELARAMATGPKLLLLDEPAAGMNQEEIQQLDDRLQAIRKRGITILLVEHVMELVMGVTDRIAVLNFGQKIAEGTPTEIQADRSVQEAYLGQRAD